MSELHIVFSDGLAPFQAPETLHPVAEVQQPPVQRAETQPAGFHNAAGLALAGIGAAIATGLVIANSRTNRTK